MYLRRHKSTPALSTAVVRSSSKVRHIRHKEDGEVWLSRELTGKQSQCGAAKIDWVVARKDKSKVETGKPNIMKVATGGH